MTGPVVEVTEGALQGVTDRGVHAFLGVPYAAPPLREHRLAAPQPPVPWTGARDATTPGATAPQGPYPPYVREILPQQTVPTPGEEFLNLNVWTPGLDDGRRPVFVWVHGGSFTQGTGSLPEYDGHAFARDGVVAVTVNYRLGAEGFARIDGAPDNRGLLDVVAALQWVRTNIARFGGDPDRVTVGGESAGAMAVGALLAVPAARGLFAQAVMQSGADSSVLTLAEAELVASRLAEQLEVAAPTREAIVAHSTDDLVAATSAIALDVVTEPGRWGAVPGKLPFAPHVDGTVLPEHPLGHSIDVPLLIGTTRDEYRLFTVPSGLGAATTEEAMVAAVTRLGLSADGLAWYRRHHDRDTPGDLLAAVLGDWRFRNPALAIVDSRADGGSPTFLYRFDALFLVDNDGLASCHACEIPFVFDTLAVAPAARVGARPSQATADATHAAWVAFIATGDPGWPAYTDTGRESAAISGQITVGHDLDGWIRGAWAPPAAS